MKKILSMVLVLVLVAGIAVSGTMAYLTDRDNETNVFTVGDVDIELEGTFAKGVELLPGKTVDINPVIKNVGKNDAWVWLTYAVPTKLASVVNVSVGENSKWSAPAALGTTDVDTVNYTIYSVLHTDALAAGDSTEEAFSTIGLDKTIDITPEGDWYSVVGGIATSLDWKTSNGAPAVYVNAYAIQTGMQEDETVNTAYAKYVGQWSGLNGEMEELTVTEVATAAELADAIEDGGVVVLTADVDMGETQVTIPAGTSATINLNGNDIEATQNGTTTYGTFNVAAGATLNVMGNGDVTVKTNVTNGISACIFQNDGTLNIRGGNYEANQATSVAGLQAVIAVIDNCPYNSEAVVNIYDGTFALTGQGAINLIRNWPIHADGVATLNIYGGTFKANPERTTTYLWNKDDSTPTTLNSFMNFYGGTYEAGVVYEDYNGQDDIYVAEGVNIQPYSGNN